MDEIIQLSNVSKEYKVLNCQKGFVGAILDLFSHDLNLIQ